MHEGPITVLLVEDDEDEVLLLSEAIRDAGASDITLDHAATLEKALAKLASDTFDAVLLDLSLPDSSGLGSVSSVVQAAGKAPVIVCTGLNDETVGQDAIRGGAQDYLVKNPQLYGTIPRMLRYAVERSRMIYQANRKLELAREYTELLLTKIISIANSGLGITNSEGTFIVVNPALAELVGCTTVDLVGTPWTNLLVNQNRAAELESYKKAFSRPENYDRQQLRAQRKDGGTFEVPMCSVLVEFSGDRLCRVLSFGSPSGSKSNTGAAPPKGRRTASPRLRVDETCTKLAAGRLKMAGLETVKDEVGDQWNSIFERVIALAEEIIAGHLSDGDSFTRNQDDDIIICFDQLSEQEAVSRTQAISDEVRQQILGLNADGEFADLGQDPRILHDIAEIQTETHSLEVAPGEVQNAPDTAKLITKKINEVAARASAKTKRMLSEVQKTCRSRVRDAHKRSQTEISLLMHDFDPDTRQWIAQLRKTASDRAGVVSEVDCIALGLAAQYIYDLGSTTKVPLIAVEVHYSTLVDKALCKKYVAVCQSLDERATQFLVFNIKGVPRNIRESRLAAAANALVPFSRLQMIQLEAPDLGSLDLGEATIRLVAIDYENMLGTYARDPSECRELVKKVHEAGARMVVDRVTNRDGSFLFRDLDVDFVSYEPLTALSA